MSSYPNGTESIDNKENAAVNANNESSPSKTVDGGNNAEESVADDSNENFTNTNITSNDQDSSSEDDDSDLDDDASTSTDESSNNNGLSEYERLRLRNIQRNEARLAQLGLLVPTSAGGKRSGGGGSQFSNTAGTVAVADGNNGTQSSALSNLFGSNSSSKPKRGRKKGGTNFKSDIITRHQPRRRVKPKRFSLATSTKFTPSKKKQNCNKNNYDSDDESLPPTPIELTRKLKPQSHQKDFGEAKAHYLKQRRKSRGRPKRGEYVYLCDEVCGRCGGGWGEIVAKRCEKKSGVEDYGCLDGMETVVEGKEAVVEGEVSKPKFIDFDDEDDEGRLLRCKDCRGAFHPQCMGIHGKIEDKSGGLEQKEDATHAASRDIVQTKKEGTDATVETGDEKMEEATTTNNSAEKSDLKSGLMQSNGMSQPLNRIPKRCYQCESKRKRQPQDVANVNGEDDSDDEDEPSSKKRCTSFVLEASIGNKYVLIGVNPEPSLEAMVDGNAIFCRVVVGKDIVKASPKSMALAKRKPLKVKDTTAKKIERIITNALASISDAKLQDTSCATLRKFVGDKDSTTAVVHLGGVGMLSRAMSNHVDNSAIQVEAVGTLAEIAWVNPSFGWEAVDEGCLQLVLATMDHYGTEADVQLVSCEFFRALSYDERCCRAMFASNAVTAVVQSMRRNSNEVGVLTEGR